jgi:hypothetical protein
MKRSALGVLMHSGWGVLVAVSGDADSFELLDRRRIVVADPEIPGTIQPYHHAAHLSLPESEKHLARCVASSTGLASMVISEVIRELAGRRYRVAGCAVLSASGRPLPPLEKILAAHPLIHTAEGEFFRQTIIRACEGLEIPVTAIRERDLEERAQKTFGTKGSRLQQKIATLGGAVSPPWTRDHKAAALSGLLLLQQ